MPLESSNLVTLFAQVKSTFMCEISAVKSTFLSNNVSTAILFKDMKTLGTGLAEDIYGEYHRVPKARSFGLNMFEPTSNAGARAGNWLPMQEHFFAEHCATKLPRRRQQHRGWLFSNAVLHRPLWGDPSGRHDRERENHGVAQQAAQRDPD